MRGAFNKYTKDQLIDKCIEVIEEKKPYSITELCALLRVSTQTFYSKIKANSKELEAIKELIHFAMNETNVDLRGKWRTQKHPTTEIALYKLGASQEDLQRLNGDNEKETEEQLVTQINFGFQTKGRET